MTFDDIRNDVVDLPSIPNGYGGFNWEAVGIINTAYYTQYPAAVSGQYIAFNPYGYPSSVTSASEFTFNGAYFAPLYDYTPDVLSLRVQGFNNGNELFNQAITLNNGGFKYYSFNFGGINKLTITTSGALNFAMDNFTVNENVNSVPAPATLWLVGPGLIGFIGFNRKALKAKRPASKTPS